MTANRRYRQLNFRTRINIANRRNVWWYRGTQNQDYSLFYATAGITIEFFRFLCPVCLHHVFVSHDKQLYDI